MNKPTVRVTLLESFRRYMSDECSYVKEQDVIDSITKKFEGNNYTRIGTAFHSIVETGKIGYEEVPEGEREFTYYGKPVLSGRKFDVDNFDVIFDHDQCKVALEYREEFKGAFHEVREYKDYGNAIVTGCADMIHGLTIRDIKTKYSVPNDSEYINSCQWRYYLDLFEADTFYFDLFVFGGYDPDKHKMDVRGLPLVRYHPAIECNRYPQMEQENRNLLNQFLEWADFRNLTHYLYNKKI